MTKRMGLEAPRVLEAIFRYRLIAEAVEAPPGERTALLRLVAAQSHIAPGGEEVTVSLRTLQRWARRYEEGRLETLQRSERKDQGTVTALPQATLDRAIALRKEGPARSTATLIDILERSDLVAKGAICRSTLDRHLDRHNASRRMLGVLGTKRHVRMAFERPLQFVVGDFHHGPYVRAANGEIRRALLSAFIDHCTRYLPESRYNLTEDLMASRRSLRALSTAHGLAERLYLDRGAAYRANRFHFACSALGIDLVHSKPYTSEGRGVIERFNRTVKDAFETEVRLREEAPTLEQLNEFWRAWLEERYHRRPHSETGEAPLERWNRLTEGMSFRRPDPVLLDEVLRLKARRKVHQKTSTVEVGGVAFVVDTGLRRRWVDVLYDPNDLSSVLIYFNKRRHERALPQVHGEAPVTPPQPAPPSKQSIDYLELLRREHEQRRAQETAAIRFRATGREDGLLTVARLCERIRACSGRSLSEPESSLAAKTLQSLAPVEIAICDVALKAAVAHLGGGMHASLYLQALREHVRLARKKGTP